MAGNVKVKDNRLRAFRKRIQPMRKGIYVTVGVQGKEAEASHDKSGVSMALIAGVHEFGSEDGRVPERSYLRSTYDVNLRKYRQMITEGSRAAAKGTGTAREAAFRTGETMRADVVATIKAGIPPPLVYRDGIPLWNTGQLVASITSVVHEGKPK